MRVPSLLLSALLVLVPAVLLDATPAGAHGETADLSVDVVARSGSTVEVQVALSYTDDGHPVEDAQVTASATGPGGATAGPVTLVAIGLGGYRGALPAPTAGTWTVRAESADPVASAEASVEVAGSAAPDPPDGDDSAPAGDAADEPAESVGDRTDAIDDERDDGGSDVVVWASPAWS